ncbi:testicular acid phosphatase homolog isoform X3 [Pseudophryne corroboree]|uniref:testicular acid phosphatase homolog isoform X3 n=1 Tax=Pseudophryne corroboree TaxID=495146 RepID=UPI0030817493
MAATFAFYGLFLLFSKPLFSITSSSLDKLAFVVVVYRHGDRSPIDTYPTDPYRETVWDNGLQQLTQVGIRQQYELGQYLRKRYKNFLSPSYRKEELLKFPSKDCPQYDELIRKTTQMPDYQNRVNSWKDFTERIANYTGYSAERIIPHQVWKVYDTLFCQSSHNLSLPAWATPDVLRTLQEMTAFSIETHMGRYRPKEKARLTGGILVGAVIQNFTDAIRKTSPLKMVMYSAHDSTILALQGALGIYNRVHPPYAACHMFEFYKESDGTYSVGMYYRNESNNEPYELLLPGCPSPCPWPVFTKLLAPIIPEDWRKECQLQEQQQQPGGAILALSLVVGCLTLALCGILLWIWWSNHRRH